MLDLPKEDAERFANAIREAKAKTFTCARCQNLADSETCPICADPTRDRDTLCLVTEWDSMLTLDEGGFYRGQYMILGGLLAPLEHMDADSLELDRLTQRLAEGEITELILALGATIEAENTASFLREMLARRFPRIRISRLAQGIPLGAEVKYMDRETLRQSLQFRQQL